MEARYVGALKGLARAWAQEIDRSLRPGLRLDADVDVGYVIARMPHIRFRLLRISSRMLPILDRFGRLMVDANAKEMSRVLGISIADQSPLVRAAAEAWRRDNVQLISSIPETLLGQVQELVAEAATTGMRNETLAARLQERYDVSSSRAALIARDQILKGNASLTEARHREAGITQYVWSSSKDERVRDRHQELDGQTFSWDDPPVMDDEGNTAHPGVWFQCRCVARPLLS